MSKKFRLYSTKNKNIAHTCPTRNERVIILKNQPRDRISRRNAQRTTGPAFLLHLSRRAAARHVRVRNQPVRPVNGAIREPLQAIAALGARVPHDYRPVAGAGRKDGRVVLPEGHGFHGARVAREYALLAQLAVGHVKELGGVVGGHRDDLHLLEHPGEVKNGVEVGFLAETLFGVGVVDGDATVLVRQGQEVLVALLLGEFAGENRCVDCVVIATLAWEYLLVFVAFCAA